VKSIGLRFLSLIIAIVIASYPCFVFAEEVNSSGFVSDTLDVENYVKNPNGSYGTDVVYDFSDYSDPNVIDDTTAPVDPFTQIFQPEEGTGSVGEILGPSGTNSNSNISSTDSSSSMSNLDRLQVEKEDAEKGIQENEAQISFNQEELSKELLELEKLSQDISDKEQKILELEMQEIELDKAIRSKSKELKTLQDEYNEKNSSLQERLIAMYKTRNTSYLDLLLASKSLSQFLSNYYYIEKVAKADSELLSDVKSKLDKMTQLNNYLETCKTNLAQNKEEVEKTQVALNNTKTIKNSRVIELSEEDAKLHDEIEEYRNEIRNIELEIRSLSYKYVSAKYIGGVMGWPVPGYTRITSPFGMRTHPITGVYKLHSGTDIGAPRGAAFVAANDGVVVKAGYNSAYGNMVIIDHGGGVQTLYAHGSSISVDVGQIVRKGEEVLKVGSTGYATGPHAHFEVRIDGEPVEPLDYITSYNGTKTEEVVVN